MKNKKVLVLVIITALIIIVSGILFWKEQKIDCVLIPLMADTDSIDKMTWPYYEFQVKNDKTFIVRFIDKTGGYKNSIEEAQKKLDNDEFTQIKNFLWNIRLKNIQDNGLYSSDGIKGILFWGNKIYRTYYESNLDTNELCNLIDYFIEISPLRVDESMIIEYYNN